MPLGTVNVSCTGQPVLAYYCVLSDCQMGEHDYCRSLMWTAPELLRMKQPPVNGTQKGDIYSFAILIQELAYRAHPYFCDNDDELKCNFSHVSVTAAPLHIRNS